MNSSQKVSTTLQDALHGAVEKLSVRGIDSPRLEAEILLAHILDGRKEDLILNPYKELTDNQEKRFQQLIHRRCRKEPLAYITGRREFWSLDFAVSPHVLIPRPETEGVIERMLELAGGNAPDAALRILDVGTGSGILAVTAAVELPKARVTAVDISPEALEVARTNAHRHRVAERIDFLNMDMIRDWTFAEEVSYDFILSNPPYIPSSAVEGLMPDIQDYEPRVALDGGPDGWTFFRTIIPNALSYLKPGGSLILEVGDGQAEPLVQVLQAGGGFEDCEILQDLSGKDRVVSARRGHG